MIANIDDDIIRQCKVNFESFLELLDRKKELKTESDGLLADTAAILDVKKTIVNKLFTALKKKMDGEDNPSEEVDVIIEAVFRN